MVPVFLCIFSGWYIDSRFGTNWTFVLMILGFLAGVSSAWRLAARVAAMERKELEQRKKEQLERWKTEHGPDDWKRCPKKQSRVMKQEENLYGKKYEDPGR